MIYLALFNAASAGRIATPSANDDRRELDLPSLDDDDDRFQLNWDGDFVSPECVTDHQIYEKTIFNLGNAVAASVNDGVSLGGEAKYYGAAVAYAAIGMTESCGSEQLDAACDTLGGVEEVLQTLLQAEMEVFFQCIMAGLPSEECATGVVNNAYLAVDPYLVMTAETLSCDE